MATPTTHWKSLYETDREFYELCYERSVERYGKSNTDSEDALADVYFSIGFLDARLVLDQIDEEAKHIFGWGCCSFFAMALHQLTGLPLALFTSPEAQGAGWEDWTGHVALALPGGSFLDITGVVSAADINSRYRFAEPVEPTVLGWEGFLESQFGDRNVSDPYRALEPLEIRMLQHFAEVTLREAGIDQGRN